MPHSLGRGAREGIIWEALERVDGKPTPALDPMQMSMSSEAQIRIAHDVIRTYLNSRGLRDLGEFAAQQGAAQ